MALRRSETRSFIGGFEAKKYGGEGGIITDALYPWDSLGRVGSLLEVTGSKAFILTASNSLNRRAFGDAAER